MIDVDAALLQQFIHTYTVSDVDETFNRKNLRTFYTNNLPPCKDKLFHQFLRVNFIASIKNNAHMKKTIIYLPESNDRIL